MKRAECAPIVDVPAVLRQLDVGRVAVRLARPGGAVVVVDRLAVARRLGKAHIAGDDGRIHLAGEVALDLFRNLEGEIRAPVEHREQNAFELEAGIQAAAHHADRVHQVGQAFEREIFALHGNDQGICRAEGVDCQQFERGRAVDENIVIIGGENVERLLEQEFAVFAVDHLDARACQRLGGGQHVAVARVRDAGCHIRAVDEHVVHAARGRLVHAHAGGGVGLRVKVAQQNAISLFLERRGQVDAGRRFADAALLIDDCNDFSQKNTHLSHKKH